VRGAELVDEIERAGGVARFHEAEISSSALVVGLMAEAEARFGPIDFAVNSAGARPSDGSLIADIDESEFDRQVAINLKGTWLCMREQIKRMSGRGGSIVNVASTNGLAAATGAGAYGAAKHGVVGLTRTAAAEYAARGIRINAVCPAQFDTPMLEAYLESSTPGTVDEARADYLKRIPLGRFGEATEAGELIAWLALDAPSFLTGTCIPIDGGSTA
jgi:glucose 1-dehydrogenase